MICPALTLLLKSAWSSETVPETWVPTWTVVTAWTFPVALMVCRMSPRRISAV
jgi:hypothetical protein